ncbi:MAG: hypothetical protein ACI4L6_03890 [Candidatus Onthoplasma sp.]
MAKKITGKTKKKVQLNLDIKPDKVNTKKISKSVKKINPAIILMVILFLAIGAVGGWFGIRFATRNDCFEIIGEEKIELSIGETYLDQGVKVISFGKDCQDKVNVETNLKKTADGEYYADQAGIYYITYTVDNIKYGSIFKIQKIRLISFSEASEGVE